VKTDRRLVTDAEARILRGMIARQAEHAYAKACGNLLDTREELIAALERTSRELRSLFLYEAADRIDAILAQVRGE
jgi:hypothetical protein